MKQYQGQPQHLERHSEGSMQVSQFKIRGEGSTQAKQFERFSGASFKLA